jgi:competence protein ComFC
MSYRHICSSCQELFLTPSFYKRKLSNGIEVISFYKYDEIKKLLHTKHTDLGYYIYNILAKNSFAKFAQEFSDNLDSVSLGIDDNVKSGYAHTAILNKHLKSKNITPLYNKLIAKNKISYSGKSKAFRIMNPRNFVLKSFEAEDVILVDDIITTGATLSEATNLLKRQKKEVLFCLTLTDVNQK